MGTKKRKRMLPLSLFYLKYFAYLFAGVVVVSALAVLVFELVVAKQVVYPAYYAQSQARAAQETIAGAQRVEESLIPELCRYVLFDADGTVKAGNLKKSGTADAWRAVCGQTTKAGSFYYTVIARDDGYCVLQYEIMPQYRSPRLRQSLPNPQNLLVSVWLISVLFVVLFSAFCFGRAMKKKLANLISVTEKIRNEELDFTVVSSDIREIDAVLKAMDDMREALKTSLESQWRQEQEKKEQLLSLAHDLKTPLTLVRGNVDLLNETALDEEQRECAALIEKYAGKMQMYVQTLIEMMRDGYRMQRGRVVLADFLEDARAQLHALCAAKGLLTETASACRTEEFYVDRELFMRALLNVFSNAVTYTSAGGTVFFEVRQEENELSFLVTDTGCGFCAEALNHATELFFTGDKSRGTDGHVGMGLYMADLVMKQHGGELVFGNSRETGGARVCLRLPVGHGACREGKTGV